MTVRKTFAREYIDRGRWLWSVSTCTADANDRIIRCGRTGVPVRTAASFERNYRRLHDAWGTRVTNERCRAHRRIWSDPIEPSCAFPREKYPAKIHFYVSTVRRNNSPSTTRHSTENDVFIAKCAPREHYVDATAKVGPPLTEKLFISKSTREETAVGTASPVGCIMQRLFEVRLSFFSPFSFTFSSSPSLLSSVSLFAFIRSLSAWSGGIRDYIASEILFARRENLERRIFRDTKGNVSRRSGLIIRFRGAGREKRSDDC